MGHDSLIPVSDAHTAMEYYYFADSNAAFDSLSTPALAHLYFFKVQEKPEGYLVENITWSLSRVSTIQDFRRKKLIDALKGAVRVIQLVCRYEN